MSIFEWLNQEGQGEYALDEGTDELASAWTGKATEGRPVPGTGYTTADVQQAIQNKAFVRQFPELALELLADYPQRVVTPEQLEHAMQYIDGRLQLEVKEGLRETDGDWEQVRETLTQDAELRREEREYLREQADEERFQQITEEAEAELEAFMEEHGHEVTVDSFELAMAAIQANPKLSVTEAFEAAARGEQEVERVTAEQGSIYGVMQEAAKDIPGLEDVEFLDSTVDEKYILTGEREAKGDPFAPYLDQLDVEGVMAGEYKDKSPVIAEADRIQMEAYKAEQAARVEKAVGSKPDRQEPITRDNLSQWMAEQGVEAIE